ncbi:MAG: hypothetical protein JJ979_23870, partial [Roseibium sp.]|nr:hypothetical protein [Roseibium sp.]
CSHALLLGGGTATHGPVDEVLNPDQLVAQGYLSQSQASWMFRRGDQAREQSHA